jgi:hypothetical protein
MRLEGIGINSLGSYSLDVTVYASLCFSVLEKVAY